jgi:hypothetical protein
VFGWKEFFGMPYRFNVDLRSNPSTAHAVRFQLCLQRERLP